MEAARNSDGSVGVTFTHDEALVVSHLLSRWVDKDRLIDHLTNDQAERRVLSDLTASFEPIIDEAFNDDYDEIVERARVALRNPSA